ncbi:hypothetical protein BD626DRAFT_56471 [Schizophyllum amplum]|uniref:Uncharacterized protein n=1 Tax=Schizophyllum amplum TaxID=97359 RepID=A0A550BSH9_9AGAR|nr:hypothetical protein BD626DRAFT_56471 [Auriculariopsis ampla]
MLKWWLCERGYIYHSAPQGFSLSRSQDIARPSPLIPDIVSIVLFHNLIIMSLPSSTLYAAQPAFRPPPRSRVLNMHVARPGPRAPQYTPQCPPGLAARQANPGSLGNGLFGGGNDGIWGQDVLSVPMNPSPYPVTPQKRPSAAEYGRRRPQSQAAYMAAAQRSAGIENRMPRWDGRSQYAIRPPSPSRGPRDNWNNGRQPRAVANPRPVCPMYTLRRLDTRPRRRRCECAPPPPRRGPRPSRLRSLPRLPLCPVPLPHPHLNPCTPSRTSPEPAGPHRIPERGQAYSRQGRRCVAPLPRRRRPFQPHALPPLVPTQLPFARYLHRGVSGGDCGCGRYEKGQQ